MAKEAAENERVRGLYEKEAPKYDRQMRAFERVLFSGGREWVCSQARGEVLEIAIGTGRNLSYFPAEVSLTGIEFSPAMLKIARQKSTTAQSRDRPSRRRCAGARGP